MPSDFTPREIAEKYDGFARWYDWVEGIPELLGVRALRRRLLQHATGDVLEVAAGTGKNLAHYPRSCRITAVDLSHRMLTLARRRAARIGSHIDLLIMDGASLGFSEKTFDTVVSSLSTCTFPDPAAALREMARVCRPGGRILLLEHGRSDRPWLARRQDRRADRHAAFLGCHWNRNPPGIVQQAGLRLVAMRRVFFGIFYLLEAKP